MVEKVEIGESTLLELFRLETFPDGESFLVWLIDKTGKPFWSEAQYAADDYNDEGEPLGPLHITGTWRYDPETERLEPVAYQAGPRGPNDEEARP